MRTDYFTAMAAGIGLLVTTVAFAGNARPAATGYSGSSGYYKGGSSSGYQAGAYGSYKSGGHGGYGGYYSGGYYGGYKNCGSGWYGGYCGGYGGYSWYGGYPWSIGFSYVSAPAPVYYYSPPPVYYASAPAVIYSSPPATVTPPAAPVQYSKPIQPENHSQAIGVVDVKALTKAGLDETVIISQIRSSRATFRLSTAEIIDMKNSGVSEKVINFMINTATP